MQHREGKGHSQHVLGTFLNYSLKKSRGVGYFLGGRGWENRMKKLDVQFEKDSA